MHAPNPPHGTDRTSTRPQGELQFSDPSYQDDLLSPDAAHYDTTGPDDSGAPGTGPGRGAPGRRSTGRGAMVTPAELYAHAEDARGASAGRRPRAATAAGQARPTFHGRDVSLPHAPGHPPPRPGQESGAKEAPAGSRRYLANRAEAAHAATGHYPDLGAAMPAAPSMVPVHHVDDDPQNVHFNPNAPGFLPMGGEPAEGSAAMPGPAVGQPVAGGMPPPRAPGALLLTSLFSHSAPLLWPR